MRHTYDSLRDLAIPVVTTPSVDAPIALFVLRDALEEAGILLTYGSADHDTTESEESREKRAREWEEGWVFRWVLKAVYGASRVSSTSWTHTEVFLAPSTEQDAHHRKWSEMRIALRRRGVRFRGTMKRHEIEAALRLPVLI